MTWNKKKRGTVDENNRAHNCIEKAKGSLMTMNA